MAYHDSAFQFQTIRSWETSHGLKHHKDVQTLIDADAELSTVTEPVVQTSDYLDPATVAQAVRANAEVIAIADGPLSTAMAQARTVISTNAVKAARANTEHYRSQLTKTFTKAADQYAAALEQLPEEFTSADLAKFTAEQFDAYRSATAAAGVIATAKSWLQSLTILSTADSPWSSDLLVVEPQTPEQLATTQAAKSQRHSDASYAAILPTIAKAVRAGAVLRLAIPAERDQECSALQAELEQRQAEKHKSTVGRVAW